MNRYPVIALMLAFLIVSCTDSSNDGNGSNLGVFVVDSIFPSAVVHVCDRGGEGISASCRIVYHFENLPGGIVGWCLKVEESGGGLCMQCDIPECQLTPGRPGRMMEEILFSLVRCGSETDLDTITMALEVESWFWSENTTILEQGIRYYNNYIWTDTIRVEVKSQ